MTRSDVVDLLQGGPENPDKKRAILKTARQRLTDKIYRTRMIKFGQKKTFSFQTSLLLTQEGLGPALEFMSWLGLNLSPDFTTPT